MHSIRAPRTTLLALAVATTLATAAPSAGAEETSVDDQAMAEARRHFQAGVNLLDDPDGARYEEAYHAFHKAYALSRSPKVLGNIGFCSLKLERDGEAIEAYTTYLRESRDVDPRERSQIEKDIATLSSTVASFKALVKAQGELVLVDTRVQTRGTPVVNTYSFRGPDTTIRLRPGRHSLKVKANDTETRTFELTIEPSSQHTHEFTFAPPPVTAAGGDARRTRPSYAGPIVLGVAGLAGLGAGTVAGLMARGTTEDIESRCPNDLCPAAYDLGAARSEAKTLGTIADAAFIGGGVALGSALLWALVTPSASGPRTPRTGSLAKNAPVAGAGCAASGCGVHVGGQF